MPRSVASRLQRLAGLATVVALLAAFGAPGAVAQVEPPDLPLPPVPGQPDEVVPAEAPQPDAAATLSNVDGDQVGTVTFTDVDGATLVAAELSGLPAGFHGFHIHANPNCDGNADPPFGAAGGHFDPGEADHGEHAGDMPVLLVNADGSAQAAFVTDRFTAEELANRSVIVHAAPDNYANIPDRYEPGPDEATLGTGDAGGRLACGVIQSVAPPQLPDLGQGAEPVSAMLIGPDGQPLGSVSFAAVDGGVRVDAAVSGLSPGFHGFHLHAGPACTDADGSPEFVAAAGHYDPGAADHGGHAGDMPVLLAGDDGSAAASFVTDRFAVSDLTGRAVIVHAEADNYANIPTRYVSGRGPETGGPDRITGITGDAGDRDACGVVGGQAVRLFGPERLATAVKVSRSAFPVDGSAEAVVLARSERFADGLAGTPLAVANGAPLLLTPPGQLHPATAAELERVLRRGATVYLLGGEQALSAAVEEAVGELGFAPKRVFGATRIETAIAVARELGDPATLLITTGFVFPDALTAGAAASNVDGAVLLTPSGQPHPALDAYLADNDQAEVYAIGGPAAKAYDEATPVVGRERMETAVLVAEQFFDEPAVAGLARQGGAGDDSDTTFADALTGGAQAGRLGGPVLLSPTASLHALPAGYLCDQAATLLTAYLYGGSAALSEGVLTATAARVAGQGC